MQDRRILVRAALAILCAVFSLAAKAQSETDFYDNGIGLMGQKKFAQAEAEFRKSVHADPRYKEAWEQLAAAMEAQGKDAAQVKKMAAAAPAARAGAAPALSDEQKAALGEAGTAPRAPADAKDAEIAALKKKLAELEQQKTPAPAPVPAPAPAPRSATPAAPAPVPAVAKVPDVPIEKSDIVVKNPDGTSAVAQKDGKPYDGLKVSQYDADIFSPQLAVAADGTIHLAFVERMAASPFSYFVFHRTSSDGGKTWSDPKNLSEVMPNINVGNCKLLIDGKDRVYVVWRSSLKQNFPVSATPAGLGQHNLVYRVLDHGKWSKVLPVHPPGSAELQNNGSCSFTAMVDAAGRVQVIWDSLPDEFHPEKYTVVAGQFHQHCPGIMRGLVFQATLDGTTPAQPRELFCANFHEKPDSKYAKFCDDLDAIDGFADAGGACHFIAWVRGENYRDDPNIQISYFERTTGAHVLTLPSSFTFEASPPKLLIDAAGKKHIIAHYPAGEHPSFRDYVVGSEDEPTVLLSAPAPKGTCMGFQAHQGPGGKMIVLMQTTDEGTNDRGDNWVTTSTGGEWSKPLCVTNNAGREKWWAKDTGVLGGVAGGSRYGPGVGAAAIDKAGHLVLVVVNVQTGSFGLSAGGVVYSSGSSSTPRLCFYRF